MRVVEVGLVARAFRAYYRGRIQAPGTFNGISQPTQQECSRNSPGLESLILSPELFQALVREAHLFFCHVEGNMRFFHPFR